MCADPGIMPIRKPITLPRAIALLEALRSCRVGINSRNVGCLVTACIRCEAAMRISEMPNRPTATGTMPMPSESSITSNENRV
ncbi:hypothetical protein D3C83_92220 [compost metagenome]